MKVLSPESGTFSYWELCASFHFQSPEMVYRILERSEQGCIAPEHFPIASLSTLLQGPEVPPRPPDNNLVFGGSCVPAGTKGG